MEFFIVFLLPVIFGLFIGVLAGMLGVGGGTIMIPLFRLGFGMEALAATATSLFAIFPTSVAGAISHIRQKTCNIPLGVAMGIGGACMMPVGVLLAVKSPAWAIMLSAAVIIGYSSITMLYKSIRMGKEETIETCGTQAESSDACVIGGVESAATSGERESAREKKRVPDALQKNAGSGIRRSYDTIGSVPKESSRQSLAIGFAIGLVAGLLGGYVGLGGGFIMVPMMISVLHMPMKRVSGTSLIAMVILLIPGLIMQATLGNIDFLLGILMAIGSIPGASIGALLVKRISERTLRMFFGLFLLVAAAMLVINEFIGLGLI